MKFLNNTSSKIFFSIFSVGILLLPIFFDNEYFLTLDDIKFIITVLSILSAFSQRYSNDKASEYCFALILINCLFFFFVKYLSFLAPSKFINLSYNAFIIGTVIYFFFTFSSMATQHNKKQNIISRDEFLIIFNKSINQPLNNDEKIKIKKFCKSEIERLKLLPIHKHKYLQFIFNKKYNLILQDISMYTQIDKF